MQAKKTKRLFLIEVMLPKDRTRVVKVKAVSREVAEHKALKFNPNAIGVKQPT